ncbi:MAG TPA: AMP-binding protein [Balneolaceae bacterium]|nr:AMP-binding protein [Balneolaceae bacterium]
MNGQNCIPSFDDADPENLFLGSSFGLHSYEDLIKFEQFFIQFLFDFEHDFSKPIGFLSSSTDTLIFAIAACWKLGIPFVPFSPKATAAELEKQVSRIKPGLIFVDDEHKSLLNYEQKINIKQLDLNRSLEIEVEQSFDAKNYKPTTEPDQIFGYFFTSGTSGTPKIVPLKRRQMLYAAEASAANFKPRPNHFWLLCLPLNHVSGVSIILRSILYGSAIFRMNSFHPRMIITFLAENKLFQAASLVPSMLKQLLDKSDFLIHKNFQAFLLGGGPIDSELIHRSNDKGVPLVPSYGMTESCAQIAANPIQKPSGIYSPLSSVGKVFSPNEIQIRSEENECLKANNSGLIWLKGPQVFDGYFDQDNTPYFDENGWFNTGDYGYLNAHGYLFIESRRKDLIISGGENVSPFEVESALEKISPIIEAAVMGLPDKKWGQKVVAVVVAKTEQSIDLHKIQQELKKRITSFKVPKQIIQAKSLPKTQTGKVRRDELLKLFE